MQFTRKWRFALAAIAVVLVVMAARAERASVTALASTAPNAQDITMLDHRISMIEQRLFSLEANVNRLQQQAIVAERPSPSTGRSDQDVTLMREQIQILQQQIRLVECGMARLDERTLPAGARASRERPTDPCRLNPQAPLQLP